MYTHVLRLTRVMRIFKMSRKFTGLILLGQVSLLIYTYYIYIHIYICV